MMNTGSKAVKKITIFRAQYKKQIGWAELASFEVKTQKTRKSLRLEKILNQQQLDCKKLHKTKEFAKQKGLET